MQHKKTSYSESQKKGGLAVGKTVTCYCCCALCSDAAVAHKAENAVTRPAVDQQAASSTGRQLTIITAKDTGLQSESTAL